MTTPGELSAEDTFSTRSRWWGFSFLIAAVLIVNLNQTITTISAPSIIDDLNTNVEIASMSTTIYLVIAASFLITLSRLAGRVGHRRVLVASMILFAAASALIAAAPAAWVLLIGRGLQGLVFAAVMPVSLAFINAEFPDSDRGTQTHRRRAIAFAVWATVTGIAIAAGPVWGGWWNGTSFGWRGAFMFNVAFAIVVVFGIMFTLSARSAADEVEFRGIDVVGVIILTLGIGLLVFGLEFGQAGLWSVRELDVSTPELDFSALAFTASMLVAAMLLFVLFVFIERRHNREGKVAVLDLRLFRIRSYRDATIAISLTYFGNFGLLFVSSVFIQFGMNGSAFDAGLTIAATGLGILAGGPVSTPLVHKFGPRRVVLAFVLYQPVILVVLIVLTFIEIQYWDLALMLFLYGLGWGVSYSAFLNIAYRDVPSDLARLAGAAQIASRLLAGAIGTAVLGSVIATTAGTTQSVSDSTNYVAGFRWTLAISAVVSLVGVLFAYRIPRERSDAAYDGTTRERR